MVCLYEDIKQDLKKHYAGEGTKIANQFYIPMLKRSVKYYRVSGYFSIDSLAITSAGMVGLIKNNGEMKLVVGAHDFSPELVEAFKISEEREKFLLEEFCNKIGDELEKVESVEIDEERAELLLESISSKIADGLEKVENLFIVKRLEALAWMLATKTLEIKVAIPKKTFLNLGNGIFHEKIIIMEDNDGCSISAVGSANETYQAYKENGESLWLDMSWRLGGIDNIGDKKEHFQNIWGNSHPDYFVFSLPKAVEIKIHERFWKPDPPNFDPEDFKEISKGTKKDKKINLREYQKDAINKWIDNNFKGIFEMATGTGKTFTALGCLKQIHDVYENLVCIISCPGNVLVQQWKREAEKFGLSYHIIVADSSSKTPWRDELADSLVELSLGYKTNLLVITTHSTLSADDFISIIRESSKSLNFFLIGDEVHRLGAENWSNGLIEEYDLRLGLSATPKRWFDYSGSKKIYNFFDKVVFEFGLNDAITRMNPATGETYLTPYRYIPHFVSLNDHELEDYIKKTRSIMIRFSKAKDKKEVDDIALDFLLFKRADIIKNVDEKYVILDNLIDQIGDNISWTIIYCSPDQINQVTKILFEKGIISQRFTGNEDTKQSKKYDGFSERDFILKNFAKGKIQVLVAMKILDEGVDVPPARTAILMSNSINPLQYIQRIGRVIRRYPGKTEAAIHDMVVIPRYKKMPKELREFEMNIFEKELIRYKEISKFAKNNVEALNILDEIYSII